MQILLTIFKNLCISFLFKGPIESHIGDHIFFFVILDVVINVRVSIYVKKAKKCKSLGNHLSVNRLENVCTRNRSVDI